MTLQRLRASSRQIEAAEPRSDEQRSGSGDGQVGTERQRQILIAFPKRHQSNADDGACQRGECDDGQQQLPSEPGAECGQKLEVAVTHAFLAPYDLEQPVDGPEGEI